MNKTNFNLALIALAGSQTCFFIEIIKLKRRLKLTERALCELALKVIFKKEEK